MSSCLQFGAAGAAADWLPPPASCMRCEGRDRVRARYMYDMRLSGARERSAQTQTEKNRAQQQPLGHYCNLRTQRTQGTATQTQGKFGAMQSVYQHLLSLLFIFNSLQLQQLADGCSCALTHPQDAYCNSDIGE